MCPEKIRFVPRSSARWTPTTTTIGNTTSHTTAPTAYIRGCPITTTVAGLLLSVGLNLYTAAGNIRLAIYSTYSGGKFSGLLGQSASTPAVAGWNDLSVGEVYLAASTTYYIAYQFDNALLSVYYVAGGTLYSGDMAYGVFVDPSAALSSTAYTVNMRIISGKFT